MSRAATRRRRHVLIYDGSCGVCLRTVAVLRPGCPVVPAGSAVP